MSEQSEGAGGAAPIFVACGARSGSTLLRFILDAHPDVACPPETDVVLVARRYLLSAVALYGAGAAADPAVQARIRQLVVELVSPHLRAVGATRWCDKSLTNAEHLDTLAAVWPSARFVLLHRHCMDVIASAVEASPWGLMGYGLEPYAATNPSNMVAALSRYWAERATKLLDFEDRYPDRCLRLTYEDLVTDPDRVAASLWAHIGVTPLAGAAAAAFRVSHQDTGSGDYKIWYTDRVHRRSMGRGWRVPVHLLPPPMLPVVTALHTRLGYGPVDRTWPSPAPSRSPVDVVVEGAVDSRSVEVLVMEGDRERWRLVVDLESGSWQAVTGGSERGIDQAWVDVDALADLCTGSLNIGTALRRRSVSWRGSYAPTAKQERAVFGRLADVLLASGAEILQHLPPAPT